MNAELEEWKARAEKAEAKVERLHRLFDEQATVSATQFVRAMREKARAERAEAEIRRLREAGT